MLMVGNDIQMVLGSSYMITLFVSWHDMSLYHAHLAFDIVSFVGVSNAAAMVCWTYCAHKLDGSQGQHQKGKWFSFYFTPRHRATYSFAVMFMALTVMLCVRLDDWSLDEPGNCYYSRFVTLESSTHPAADRTYVAITSVWMIFAMLGAIFVNASRRRWTLITAFLQFPVHLYMALALRTVNQGKLEGEETNENSWDFGQTTALVLLALAFGELYVKGREFVKFERAAREDGFVRVDDAEHGVMPPEDKKQQHDDVELPVWRPPVDSEERRLIRGQPPTEA